MANFLNLERIKPIILIVIRPYSDYLCSYYSHIYMQAVRSHIEINPINKCLDFQSMHGSSYPSLKNPIFCVDSIRITRVVAELKKQYQSCKILVSTLDKVFSEELLWRELFTSFGCSTYLTEKTLSALMPSFQSLSPINAKTQHVRSKALEQVSLDIDIEEQLSDMYCRDLDEVRKMAIIYS